jgi:transcriptional regulator
VKILEGDDLLQTLKDLTNKYEKHSQKPVTVEGMSKKFVDTEIRGIVAFSIQITSIEASFKLSQNRDDKNHEEIIRQLRNRGDANSVETANEMARLRKK